MAGKLRTPREIGHELANEYDASCLLHEALGWSHGPRCEAATAAIQAHEDAVREEALSMVLADIRVEYDNDAESIESEAYNDGVRNCAGIVDMARLRSRGTP